MVTNGHFHGNSQNGETDHLSTQSLKRLIDELAREVATVKKPITLKSDDSGVPYVRGVNDALIRFIQKANEEINQAEVNIGKRVHAQHRDIARSYVDKLKAALADIEHCGKRLNQSGMVMVEDLFSSSKRNEAVNDSTNVLSAIMKFFLLCDELDVYFIIESIDLANSLLHDLRNARTIEEVEERYSMLLQVLEEIDESTSIRIAEVRSSIERDDLLAASSLVKSTCPLVHSTTKALISHPEYASLCDTAHSDMKRALEDMRQAWSGNMVEGGFGSSSLDKYERLAAKLDRFQNRFMMDSSQYRGKPDRDELEDLLEEIVKGSASIADEPSTRIERKHMIVDECNHLRQALQELLKEYETNRGKAEASEDVDLAMVLVERRMKDLKRHLRRAIVDNVGDAFLDQRTPLLVLIDAATRGDREFTNSAAEEFTRRRIFDRLVDGEKAVDEHRITQVARLATEMSNDIEGIRHVKHASTLINRLVPQVVQAAYLLCENPQSQPAQEHMEVLRSIWESKVGALTLGVDSLLSLDDFLAVSESHIVDDSQAGIMAIHEMQANQLDLYAGAIRGRSLRVCDIVDEEMKCLEMDGIQSQTVKQATVILREEVTRFSVQSEALISRLEQSENMSDQQRKEEADIFADSCGLVLNSVKNIRNALLVNRNLEDVDSDCDYEDDGQTHIDQKSIVSDVDNQQKLMRKLPEEDKKKIQEQIDVFKMHQRKFEAEVAKWDETGNDIIVLAKHMCMIMMNMTDFTRGRGPLKSTMDVIRAAQEISTAGQKLSVLARQIGEEAEETNVGHQQLIATKTDLLAYLDKMVLFCQQLNICSRVKADVQQVGNELVVSGLDSAMSLIQTARNLLSAVVSTVKNAYIISTKFRSKERAPRVEWKMTHPKKQPLVSITPSRNGGGSNKVVRRASEKRPMPLHVLNEFTR